MKIAWVCWVLASITPIAVAESATPEMVVHLAETHGTIRPLHGVNGVTRHGALDLGPHWKKAGIPMTRLHDCHWPTADAIDMHVVFPHPESDPNDPASYDFRQTDALIDAVMATGAGIVYRLGESIEHDPVKRHVHPPRDPARWAAACVGVIRHYTEGWANGRHYPIRYWEIWNEPDNRPAMWTGNDDQYLALYAAAATAIKKQFPKLQVGGPAIGNSGSLEVETLDPPPFLIRFLDHCRRHSLPLDFFSWHCYTDDPWHLTRRAKGVRHLLDDRGFHSTKSHLNEWNYLPDNDWSGMLSPDANQRKRWNDRIGGVEGAAFSAASLLLLQDAPVSVANYFSAEPRGMGLFLPDGTPRTSFRSMEAFHALCQTPRRCAVRPIPEGMAVMAGIDDGQRATILMASVRGPARQLLIHIAGAPWVGPTRLTVKRIDSRHDNETETRVIAPREPFEISLEPPCLLFIEAAAAVIEQQNNQPTRQSR